MVYQTEPKTEGVEPQHPPLMGRGGVVLLAVDLLPPLLLVNLKERKVASGPRL